MGDLLFLTCHPVVDHDERWSLVRDVATIRRDRRRRAPGEHTLLLGADELELAGLAIEHVHVGLVVILGDEGAVGMERDEASIGGHVVVSQSAS